jgi:regulator of protease activity HflC (stomatin/prohibitin superfamily)
MLAAQVTDAYKASYGVEDPHFAVTQLAQTTMRSEIGKLTLDRMFEEREMLNQNIVRSINESAADWGIRCMRYEIRDISPPRGIKVAMEMQAEAERRKRALILDSEGEKDAEINIATGKKMARVLASEAVMQERINLGKGDAAAVEAHAVATATATRAIAEALGSERGAAATSLRLAEQYVQAFKAIAQSGSTVIVPANAGDIGAMVAQAMAIYKHSLQANPAGRSAGGDGDASADSAAQNRGQGSGSIDQAFSEANRGEGGSTSSLGAGADAKMEEGATRDWTGDSAVPQPTSAFQSDFKDPAPGSR